MEDRVCNGRRDADHPQLSHALDAERIDHRVVLLDEHRLDLVNVSIDGDVVVLEVRIHDTTVTMVDLGRLVQGHAKSPHDAAYLLAM